MILLSSNLLKIGAFMTIKEKNHSETLNNRIDDYVNEKKDVPKYVSVKQLSKFYPAFSELSLRWILFNRNTNNANTFVIKVGKKKLIIDTEKFEIWLNQQQY